MRARSNCAIPSLSFCGPEAFGLTVLAYSWPLIELGDVVPIPRGIRSLYSCEQGVFVHDLPFFNLASGLYSASTRGPQQIYACW